MSRADLMAHQREGVTFLLDRGSGIIAFEQGLGKTLVAIEAFERLRGQGVADTLVVLCPNSLKRNWAAEIEKFAPQLQTERIGGSARQRRDQLATVDSDVVIVNYASARADIIALRAFLRRSRCVLVLDESHHVKNRESLTSTAARQFAPLAVRRWLLSGTPVTNRPEDIWAQLEVVTAGASPLGSFERFMLDYGDAADDSACQEALAEALAPYLRRRTKEDCLDLPEKTFVDLHVSLSDWQRKLYDDFRDNLVTTVRGMSAAEYRSFAPTALTRLLRLSQIASNPSLLWPDEDRDPSKFRELDSILDELVDTNERKVIVWSYYVDSIKELADRYRSYGAVSLYGGTPEDERHHVVDRFQQDPDTRVFVGNPAAAGTGFTLTGATYAVYETLNWRYDLYAQSQDRNHRIGQEAPVTYIRLLAENTIDQVVAEALERKTAMARGVIGDERKGWSASSLSPDEFCHMITANELPGRLAGTAENR